MSSAEVRCLHASGESSGPHAPCDSYCDSGAPRFLPPTDGSAVCSADSFSTMSCASAFCVRAERRVAGSAVATAGVVATTATLLGAAGVSSRVTSES